MAEQTPRVATGPALMAELLELQRKFDELGEQARQHWGREEQRMRLVDQFIDPQLNLEGLLKQMVDALERHRRIVAAVEQELRRLSGAVELAIGAGEIARERNGTERRG